ncbi:MAG TPA: methyl-accepting chemotaxis protein [Steroidobacteraceae bacterium]|nr:methyl-accepting chemotaxis protein [Steroidobacteraceae bacterium]
MSKVSVRKTGSARSNSSKSRTAAAGKLSYADLAGQVAAIRRSQAVIELGMDGTILWANDNYLKVFGYSLDEVRGQHHRIFVPPAARDSAEYRAFWEKLQKGEPQSGRQRRYHKEGRVVWIRASYNPIADLKGKLVKVVALAQDITETIRKSTEYEGELKAVSNAQAVIEFATDGTILTANENFLKAVGYTLEEIRGKHHGVLLDPAQRGSAEFRAFWDKLARGEGEAGQYRRVGKGGREVWLQSTYNPIRDMDDKTFKVVEYSTDITEQVRQSELNAAFKGALDNLSANVMVADIDLNIIYLNNAMRDLMGGAQDDFRKDLPSFDASRLLGASIDGFHRNPAHQRNLLASLEKTFTSQIAIGGRTLRISANPMVDAGGRRLGTVLEWADRTAELGIASDIKALVQSATSGDLSQRMDLSGKSGVFAEIGKGINQLTENMSEVVSIVQAAAIEVSRGAVEISQGNADLSQRTEEQAASLEETASSMEQMTSTVKQNADNASQASQLATAARDQADKGGSVVGQAVRAMAEINEASKKIVDIIGVIDEIAFQTNLLALNAAVEAARAGEQGRGFAVVASEVRNLAGRSATAAKEIKALIQDSVRKVEEGSQLVIQSGQTLDHIVTSVKKVSDIVGEIAGASREQSAGIEQVNKAVVQLDEMTQQNAALVEQASAASHSMADQAKSLNQMMERYQVSAEAAAAAAAQASNRRSAGAATKTAAAAAAPAARAAAPARAAAKPAVKAAAGGSDDWTEF